MAVVKACVVGRNDNSGAFEEKISLSIDWRMTMIMMLDINSSGIVLDVEDDLAMAEGCLFCVGTKESAYFPPNNPTCHFKIIEDEGIYS